MSHLFGIFPECAYTSGFPVVGYAAFKSVSKNKGERSSILQRTEYWPPDLNRRWFAEIQRHSSALCPICANRRPKQTQRDTTRQNYTKIPKSIRIKGLRRTRLRRNMLQKSGSENPCLSALFLPSDCHTIRFGLYPTCPDIFGWEIPLKSFLL